jgi:hypothetical protein
MLIKIHLSEIFHLSWLQGDHHTKNGAVCPVNANWFITQVALSNGLDFMDSSMWHTLPASQESRHAVLPWGTCTHDASDTCSCIADTMAPCNFRQDKEDPSLGSWQGSHPSLITDGRATGHGTATWVHPWSMRLLGGIPKEGAPLESPVLCTPCSV